MEIKVKLEEKSLRLSYAFSPVLLNQNSNLEIPSSSFGLQNFKALLIFVSISITYVACSQPEMPVLRHHRSYLLPVNTKCRHLGPPPSSPCSIRSWGTKNTPCQSPSPVSTQSRRKTPHVPRQLITLAN